MTNVNADGTIKDWQGWPRIQDCLSKLLSALGFETMAIECSTEENRETLKRYARIIAKNWPDVPHEMNRLSRTEVVNRLRILRLL